MRCRHGPDYQAERQADRLLRAARAASLPVAPAYSMLDYAARERRRRTAPADYLDELPGVSLSQHDALYRALWRLLVSCRGRLTDRQWFYLQRRLSLGLSLRDLAKRPYRGRTYSRQTIAVDLARAAAAVRSEVGDLMLALCEQFGK